MNVSVNSMTNDELLSKTISYLRFPLTVGVVFIHFDLSQGLDIGGMTYGLDNPAWYYYIINLMSGTLASIAVPLFFLISGFLFFYRKNFDGTVYKQKLKSRVMTLFVPYLLWNFIAVVWQLKCFLPGVSSFYPPVEVQVTPLRLFNTFFCNTAGNGIFLANHGSETLGGVIIPIDGPLWYVRDLMVMVVVSPVIYWLIKRIRIWYLLYVGIVWYFSPFILPKDNYTLIYINMIVTAAFFFSIGAYFSIHKENFVMCFRKLKYVPLAYLIIAIADVMTKEMVFNSYIHKLGILLGIVSVVIMTSYLLEHKKIKVNATLANSSFFIFALHYMIITNIGKVAFILLRVPDNNPFAMLTLYFGTVIVTITICLVFYVLLKRYMPRTCNLLTGGR